MGQGKSAIVQHHLSVLHLQATDVPFDNLKCPVGCRCVAHRQSIDTYYKYIVCALKCASSVCVPRIPFKCLKPFWSDELDRLKEQSTDMHKL